MKRELEQVRRIHMIPYFHTDYAWCNIRAWHICRYVTAYEQMLLKMRTHPDYTGTLDNIDHSLEPFLRYRPALAEELRQRVREGRITVANGGWSLARVFQVGEETYLRNLTEADAAFRRLFGQDLPIRCLFNADTSCGHAQLPQIIRLMGYDAYCFQRPEAFLNRQGIPKSFRWKGLDGSQVLVTRGCYGGFGICHYLETPPTQETWPQILENFRKEELDTHLQLLPTDVMAQFVGMDDTLPDCNCSDRYLYMDAFMQLWNQLETPQMHYSTLHQFLEELDQQALPTVSGDIDPYDLSYNVPKKGCRSLWYARHQAERLLTEAEAAAVIAAGYGMEYPAQQLDTLWKSLFRFTGHAMEFALLEDQPELQDLVNSTLSGASRLLRETRQAIADAVCATEENAYAVINTTGAVQRQSVRIPLTDVFGVGYFRLEDETGEEIPFAEADYITGCRQFATTCYSSAVAVADVTVLPYSVKKIFVHSMDQIRTKLTRQERSNLLTATPSGRREAEHFTICAGQNRYVFENRTLMEIQNGSQRIRTGKPLLTLRFRASDPPKNWLFWNGETRITDSCDFQPSQAVCVLDTPLCTAWQLTGTLLSKPVQMLLTAGTDGILQIQVTLQGGKEIGYYSLDYDADTSGILHCDIPFGIRTVDFSDMAPEDTSNGENGEVSMQGSFQAKSYVNFQNGHPLTAFGIDTATYWRYDLKEHQVCCLLTAVYDAAPVDPACEDLPWEAFMDTASFQCPGAHTFRLAALPFETDPARLAAVSQGLRHPLEAKKGFRAEGRTPAPPIVQAPENLIFTACRKTEDETVIRFYECSGRQTQAFLQFGQTLRSVRKCDLRGRTLEVLPCDGSLVPVTVRPYEIVILYFR